MIDGVTSYEVADAARAGRGDPARRTAREPLTVVLGGRRAAARRARAIVNLHVDKHPVEHAEPAARRLRPAARLAGPWVGLLTAAWTERPVAAEARRRLDRPGRRDRRARQRGRGRPDTAGGGVGAVDHQHHRGRGRRAGAGGARQRGDDGDRGEDARARGGGSAVRGGRVASGTSTDAVVVAATGRGRRCRFGGPISELAGWWRGPPRTRWTTASVAGWRSTRDAAPVGARPRWLSLVVHGPRLAPSSSSSPASPECRRTVRRSRRAVSARPAGGGPAGPPRRGGVTACPERTAPARHDRARDARDRAGRRPLLPRRAIAGHRAGPRASREPPAPPSPERDRGPGPATVARRRRAREAAPAVPRSVANASHRAAPSAGARISAARPARAPSRVRSGSRRRAPSRFGSCALGRAGRRRRGHGPRVGGRAGAALRARRTAAYLATVRRRVHEALRVSAGRAPARR